MCIRDRPRHGRKRLGPRRAGYRRSAPVPAVRRTRQDDHNKPAAPRCSQTPPSPLVRPPGLPLLSLRIARFGGHRNDRRRRTARISTASLRIARFGGHRNGSTQAAPSSTRGSSLRIARFGGHRNTRRHRRQAEIASLRIARFGGHRNKCAGPFPGGCGAGSRYAYQGETVLADCQDIPM